MKSYCIIYFEHRNDVGSKIKLNKEYFPLARILYTNLDYASDVVSMFKINYTIALHEISVNYNMEGFSLTTSLDRVDNIKVISTFSTEASPFKRKKLH